MTGNDQATRARGGTPSVEGSSWWREVWKPFWAIPVACVVAAVAFGVLMPVIDGHYSTTAPYVFQGGPDGARGLLGNITTGMISMTGLVFSITMVILQLASSQYSPRVIGGFLQKRITQVTLGVFMASFVYAMTVTRSVRGDYGDHGSFVPQISVTVAFLLVLASVGCFLAFIHHITSSIQVSKVISSIGDRTLELADRMYPKEAVDGSVETGPTWSPAPDTPRVAISTQKRHGQIVFIDYDKLVEFARDRDAVVTIDRPVGFFLVEGQDVLRIWGIEEMAPDDIEKLYTFIGLGSDRELRQDVAFGIRQLVDIGVRALSPGINDPSTCLLVLNELHRILRRLVQRESPSPYIADEEGAVRVVHQPQSIDDHIDLAIEQINHYGKDTLLIPRRLRAMLTDLESASAQRYLPALRRAREAVDGPLEQAG